MKYSVEPDGQTVKVILNGEEHTFLSLPELGKIISVIPQGKSLRIVCEHGIETLYTALDPSRFRLLVSAKSPRKIVNLRQADYILKRRNRNGRISNTDRRTKTPT